MTLESLDKLRDCNYNPGYRGEPTLEMIADEIQAEVDSRYMELPLDADGVPIRFGDAVEGELLFDNETVKGTVVTYHLHSDDEPDTVYIKAKPSEDTWTIKELRLNRCRHVKPRTVEDVLRDCCKEWNRHCGDDWEQGVYAKYAAELRMRDGDDR